MSTGFAALPPPLKALTWGYYGVSANSLNVEELIEGNVYSEKRSVRFDIFWAYRQIVPIVVLADPRAEELLPESGVNHEAMRTLVRRVAHTTYVWSPRYCFDNRVPEYSRGDYHEYNLALQMKVYRLHSEAIGMHCHWRRDLTGEMRQAIETIGDVFWRLQLFDETPFRQDAARYSIDPQEVGRVVLRYENGIMSEHPATADERRQLWGDAPARLAAPAAPRALTLWERAADFAYRCFARMRDSFFGLCRRIVSLRCFSCLSGVALLVRAQMHRFFR
ncbi:MAG: hypothetical protein ACHQT8_03970 [Chlamydiales bacterium]